MSFDDAEKEKLEKIIRDACARLSEHFDTVQIFVTKNPKEVPDGDLEAGDTPSISRGVGNYFARYGQVHDWLVCQKANNYPRPKED